jgi:hypothetical protein
VRLRSGAAPVAGALGARASLAAGLLLFGGGFLLESVADWQKFVWKSNPANQGRFMGPVGLYAYSRYPNYFVSAPPAAAAAVLLSAAPPPLPCLSLPMTGRVGLLSTLSPAAYLRRCCHAAAAAALVLAHLRPW